MIYLDQFGTWQQTSGNETTDEEWDSILSDPSCHLQFQDFDPSKVRSLGRNGGNGAETAGDLGVTE